MIKKIQFLNGNGLTLRGKIHEPPKYSAAVVVLHGFLGNCEYSVPANLGRDLEKAGYLVLRFDFSNTDSSDGKLEDKTMSSEAEDIKSAINFLEENYNFKDLVLIGHSTGAIDAVLYAYKDKRISKLIILSGVGSLRDAIKYDFTDEQIKELKEKGFFTLKREGRWYNNQKITKRFYDEYFTLDTLGSLNKFTKQVLIIHGEKDKSVPVKKDPIELYKAAREPKELYIVKEGDHMFTDEFCWKEVVRKIISFIS